MLIHGGDASAARSEGVAVVVAMARAARCFRALDRDTDAHLGNQILTIRGKEI